MPVLPEKQIFAGAGMGARLAKGEVGINDCKNLVPRIGY